MGPTGALSIAEVSTRQAGNDCPIAVATIMRTRGETGVQTHFGVFRDYLAAEGQAAACLTPFCNPRMAVYPVFAARRVIGRLHRPSSVWWYRHWHYVFLKRALKRLCADGRARVLYAQCPLSAKAALEARVCEAQRVAMAVHFNVSQADEWADKGMLRKGGEYYRAIRLLERAVLPRLDGLVFVSRFMRDTLAEAIPEIARVPSAVIPNFIPLPPEARDKSRDLISIGTLEPRKNQEYLIRMVAAAKAQGRAVSLTVVGDGPDRGRLEALARELGVAGQIDFAGFRPNAAELISAHRAYCHAARIENLPLTLIESLGCGVPALAAPVGGIPEIFSDGVEGLYWDLDDPAAGARKALRLLDDARFRASAGAAGRQRFAEQFEAKVAASRLRAFLCGLSNQNREQMT